MKFYFKIFFNGDKTFIYCHRQPIGIDNGAYRENILLCDLQIFSSFCYVSLAG
jgi:hypothetical protein